MRLRIATPEEKKRRDELVHAEWGARLTVAQWVEREERLRAHPFARPSMTSYWWVDEHDQPLSSCETFALPSRARLAGQVEQGRIYGVASVVTAPALRGHGHAGKMIQAVVERVRREDPEAHGLVLYSDVGASLYGRAGFVAVPSAQDRLFTPIAGAPEDEVDALYSERELGEALARIAVPRDEWVMWPTVEQLDWQVERERAYAEFLGLSRPSCQGARAGDATAIWAADFKYEQLLVLVLGALHTESAVRVLRAARKVAHQAKLRSVVLWEEPWSFAWPADESGGEVVARKGSLPMAVALRPGLTASMLRHVPRGIWL